MENNRVVFRVDSSLDIGTGHVMRCLTLADELKRSGAECHFVARAHKGNINETIVARGFKLHSLSVKESALRNLVNTKMSHANWLGTSEIDDANDFKRIVSKLEPAWIVVDHYALAENWERMLRVDGLKLMVIDDLADRPHYCDILVDQNLGREYEDYVKLVPPKCQLLLGPKYALLRPEFTKYRTQSLERRHLLSSASSILVSMGGIDQNNVTGIILKALNNVSVLKNINIVVVMGEKAPYLANVQDQSKKMKWLTEVKVNVGNMAEIMTKADLAIGAAGSTSWERCCLGVPTLMMVLAENQVFIAEHLHKSGAAISLDRSFARNNCDLDDITSNIDALISNTEKLSELSSNAAQVVDGSGVIRIANLLISKDSL